MPRSQRPGRCLRSSALPRSRACLVAAAAASAVLLLASTAGARTWTVHADGSGDAPTIQGAVDQAAPGDSVLVTGGTYSDLHLDSRGELAIVELRPAVYVGAPAGPEATILDAASEEPERRVVAGYEAHGAVLSGFTITNGATFSGPGVYLRNSDTRIEGCLIVANIGGDGGGVLATGPGEPWIVNNRIDGNVACCGGGGGVLVMSGSAAHVEGNRISGNTGVAGGGVSALQAGPAFIRGNVIRANTAVWGGGISVVNSPVTVEGNWILDNKADDGGGVEADWAAGALFEGNVTARNQAIGHGGGYRITADATTLRNETVVGNGALAGSGIFCMQEAKPVLDHCLVASNYDGEGVYADDSGSIPSVACCDVYGNVPLDFGGAIIDPTGTNGNVSVDPLFCDLERGGYFLGPDSPVRDSGDCGLIGALAAPCPGNDVAGGGSGAVTGADGAPGRPEPGSLACVPNPSAGVVGIHRQELSAGRASAPGAAAGAAVPGDLLILDVAGRIVCRVPWDGRSAFWSGADHSGRTVAPGLYWALDPSATGAARLGRIVRR